MTARGRKPKFEVGGGGLDRSGFDQLRPPPELTVVLVEVLSPDVQAEHIAVGPSAPGGCA